MINIDARACGVGKTRGTTNSMFHDIKRAYDLGQRVVVVLPSIKIFDEYETYINSILTDCWDIATINSANDQTESTSGRLFDAIQSTKRIIVITHKTFQLYKWHKGVKKDIHLLIDEAFDPFNRIEYWDKKENKVLVDWNSVATRSNVGGEYEQLDIDGPTLNASVVTQNNQMIKDLCDSNWKNHIHNIEAELLFDPTPADRCISIIQELDADIMRDWKSVRIAAAAFDITFMSEWLRSNVIPFEVIPGCEFNKHAPLLTMHIPTNSVSKSNEVRNSKTISKAKDHWLFLAFVDYIETQNITDPVLTLRNVSSVNKNVYLREQKVNFNAHGQNNFREYTKVSIEAATNLHPDMQRFHKEFHSTTFDSFLARTGYDVYQIAMRSCLRKQPPEPADLYSLDSRLLKLEYFFSVGQEKRGKGFNKNASANIVYWDVKDYKKQPLTNAEKQKAYRARQKALKASKKT